jgi:hypothetical protein
VLLLVGDWEAFLVASASSLVIFGSSPVFFLKRAIITNIDIKINSKNKEEIYFIKLTTLQFVLPMKKIPGLC